ncbi:FkbM family methyltransferase [Anthocerotibacter panamensis]|uniref:FkbM family methyltransferase n=1 Tax=Anthocerotibacter panamensis TaxID=2857077 RepID=UPI001C40523C|nr:FkbM family methyltransferase [Anthocerotibacter panamensis]
MTSLLRRVAKSPLNALLNQPEIRRRMIFDLKHRYHADLDVTVPLGAGFTCPVYFPEAWYSFTEIFLGDEYTPVFQRVPLPQRWLDLGCHAGYFSLLVAWLRARQGLSPEIQALLVDGDSRVGPAVERLIAVNSLHTQMHFRQGLISRKPGVHYFTERGVMSSSVSELEGGAGEVKAVSTLSAADLMAALPPPYDLVKIDVEGSEYDFLLDYQPVLAQTRYLLLEWHSWHAGGGGVQQIHDLAQEQGFTLIGDVVEAHDVPVGGKTQQCGVTLYLRG